MPHRGKSVKGIFGGWWCHAAIHHFRIVETRWLKDSRDKLKSNQWTNMNKHEQTWTNMNKRQISRKSLKAHSKRQQNKKLDLSRLFQWSCCLYPHLALWSVLPQRNTQKEQIQLQEFRNSKKSKNSDRQFIETFNAVLNESLIIGWSSCTDRTLRTRCTDCSHSGWNTGYCKPALNETEKIQHLAGGGAIR